MKDEAEKKSKTYYIEDQDEGFLEAQYYTIHAEQESAEESLIKAEIIQGAYNIAGDDPYRLALIGIWSGERTVTEVAQEYQKHKSTVSHDKSDLMQEIREYMVKEGLV